MALPQFGIHLSVRVCSNCFNDTSRPGEHGATASLNGADLVTESVSRLDISRPTADFSTEPPAVLGVPECKCGMPLCICEAPSTDEIVPVERKSTSNLTVQSNPKLKKADTTPKSRGSTSNSKFSSVFNQGQVPNSGMEKSLSNYEVNGEGLREAIKNADTAAVRKLLSEGVDANYCDRQGSSLLHLAAVFNQTDIAFTLMEYGASLNCKNSQGETPLDCAPATLQFKMKKMEEGKR